MDATLLKNICEFQKRGQAVALVTIIETKGSTPRKAGSQMLVLPDGAVQGTIGGGCAEAEAKQQALFALQMAAEVDAKMKTYCTANPKVKAMDAAMKVMGG